MLEEAMLWDIKKKYQSSSTTVSSQDRVLCYARSTNETFASLSRNTVQKCVHLLFLST